MTEERKDENNVCSYLEFVLGNEKYAFELLSVLEVISTPETTPVPNSPGFLKGVMNLRGQIVTIIDLRKKMNIAAQENNREEAVIILNVQGYHLGVVVDSISRVLNIPLNEVDDAFEVKQHNNSDYVSGIYQSKEYLVFLLDFYKLLNINQFESSLQRSA